MLFRSMVYKLAFEKVKANALNSARGMADRGTPSDIIQKVMLEEWSPVKRVKTALSMSLGVNINPFEKEEEEESGWKSMQ